MLFVICLTIVTSFLVGFGISVSKDVCILMLFIQILFGLLLAIQRLVMFIVVVETLLWVQFFLKSKMDIFIIVIWIFCDLFCLTCEVIFWPIIWFFQLYLTDLHTRESVLLSTGEQPILQLALHDDSIWVASTDSSVHRWPAEVCNPQKIFQRGNSFLAGNLSFSRARVSLEGSTPVCYIYIYFLRKLILLFYLPNVIFS
jgi:hypothetical protein